MTWTDPNTRNTGDLITAQIYNDEIVTNLEHLHDRKAVQLFQPCASVQFGAVITNQNMPTWPNIGPSTDWYVTMAGIVSSDFASLATAKLAFVPDSVNTIEYDLYISYGAEGQILNTHIATLMNQSFASTLADGVKLIDISSSFSSLAANDFLLITIRGTNGAANTITGVLGLFLEYMRS